MSDSRPIGFFDSGLGGLTVLRAIRSTFPKENMIYLGDTARLPYGTKSPETIRRYTEQSITALTSRDVKAVVVACNSASTAILANRKAFEREIPIYNVIEPGARVALAASITKRIGVLGTRATVLAEAYPKALRAIDPDAFIVQMPAPLLVPLVEEGWENDPLTNLIIHRYLAPLLAHSIDTLILGCTHYPALKDGIARVAGGSVQLVDSANAIALNMREDFESGKLKPGGNGSLNLLATDTAPAMNETAKRLMGDATLPAFQACDL